MVRGEWIEVWSTKEGEQRFDNHVDKLLNYIRFWQASGESEKTSMRIRTKHLQMIQEGLYRGGLVPFGYRLEQQGRVNKKNQPVRDLVIDEKESIIVKEIFQKIVSDGWGTNRIANWLNDRGIATKNGKSYWRATSIRVIVRNPIYTGRIRFGNDLSEPFEHLRLVDDYIFKDCDRVVSEKAPCHAAERTSSLRSTSPALLTGILYCGCCGGKLCYNHNRTTRKLADGTMRTYERDVYRCYRKVNARNTCKGKATYDLERIDGPVLNVVRSYFERISSLPTADMLRAAGERVQAVNNDALEKAEAILKKAQAEMTALEEEAVKALTGESKMDLNFINSLIPKRRANLEKALAETERIRAEIENDAKIQEIHLREINMIRTWAETFETASPESKRTIIAALIDRVVVSDDYSLDIHFRISAEQYLGKVA